MKNGKLFGKINVIDFLFLLIAAAAVVIVALRFTGHLGEKHPLVGTDIRYTVRVENVPQDVYENAKTYVEAAKAAGKPGDQLMANGEILPGYVTDITAVPRTKQGEISSGTNHIFLNLGDDAKKDLTFTIEAHTEDNVKTTVGTQEVRVGKTHIVKTTHLEFSNGLILSCEWEGGTYTDG